MTRALNFNSGPATLPLAALERAQRELLDFHGTGMSVMEHSHRSKEYDAVHNEAIALVRELMDLPKNYDVLFLQGGASMQFAQIPLNFLPSGKAADYIVNGTWGEKAVAEARLVAAMSGGKVSVAGDSGTGEGKERNWVRTPAGNELRLDASAAYLHFTSNETIHGVQYSAWPGANFPDPGNVPVIVDMSSDLLWRRLELPPGRALFYAGAQKNLGPSGVTVVIADRAFVDEGRKDIPKIWQYRVHAENNSLYNTPPTFGIYLVRNVLSWIKDSGGLVQMEKWNREKAGLLYAAIDAQAGFYHCPVDKLSRSVMNVVFRLPSEALEDQFIAEAKAEHRIVGIKGHRSVGGIRVSIYNAIRVDEVAVLAGFMAEFARKNG